MTVPHVRVVAALIRDPKNGQRYFAQQRAAHKVQALLWEFPGGKVEVGESPQIALIRECAEELSIGIVVKHRLWMQQHAYAQAVVNLEIYAAQWVTGVPNVDARSVASWGWYSVPQMLELPFCEADVPFLRGMEQGLIAFDLPS